MSTLSIALSFDNIIVIHSDRTDKIGFSLPADKARIIRGDYWDFSKSCTFWIDVTAGDWQGFIERLILTHENPPAITTIEVVDTSVDLEDDESGFRMTWTINNHGVWAQVKNP